MDKHISYCESLCGCVAAPDSLAWAIRGEAFESARYIGEATSQADACGYLVAGVACSLIGIVLAIMVWRSGK